MSAMISRFDTGLYASAPTENRYVISSRRGWKGELKPLIYCHGSGDTTLSVLGKAGQVDVIRRLARHYLVIVADLGLQAWGNDTHRARIGDTVAMIQSGEFGHKSTQKVTLVGGSMGNLGAMGYAKVNPSKVEQIIGIIPAIDLTDLWANRGAASDVNAAYGGTYVPATREPDYSPLVYASSLDPAIPIHLFTASNDPLVIPAAADSFLASRPNTKRTNLGALGHTDAALAAAAPLVQNALRYPH